MGVPGSATAERLDVQADRPKVTASQGGVLELNGAGTSARAVRSHAHAWPAIGHFFTTLSVGG